MTENARRKGSPAERKQAAYEAFRTKVEILKAWGKEGLPAGEGYPRTHVALRAWRGPKSLPAPLGTWSDPLIDRLESGKYPDLADDFATAVIEIDNWVAGKAGRVGELETALRNMEARYEALFLQNVLLVAENVALKEEKEFRADLATARRRGAARSKSKS